MIRALWRGNQAWRCAAAIGLRFCLCEADDTIGLACPATDALELGGAVDAGRK